ncbi:MAG: RcnB family protein [Usitatibacteraceae bacterium]
MKKNKLVSALLAVSLATGGYAFAQRSGDRNDRNDQPQRYSQQDRRDSNDRNDNRNDNRGNNRGNHGQRDNHQTRGAGPNHNFYKGGRLPAENRNRQYVVDDWRGHRLSAPPRGYHWVQTGGDYVLVAIATGIIAQLLLGN